MKHTHQYLGLNIYMCAFLASGCSKLVCINVHKLQTSKFQACSFHGIITNTHKAPAEPPSQRGLAPTGVYTCRRRSACSSHSPFYSSSYSTDSPRLSPYLGESHSLHPVQPSLSGPISNGKEEENYVFPFSPSQFRVRLTVTCNNWQKERKWPCFGRVHQS